MTYQRLLIQSEVPERFRGRTFALTDTLVSWAMVLALLAGGALMTVFSPRELLAITGVWEVSLALLAAVRPARALAEPGPRRPPQPVTASLRRTSESSIRMSSAARLSGWASWTTSTRAATIVGSNCVPAFACSSSSASAVLIALR